MSNHSLGSATLLTGSLLVLAAAGGCSHAWEEQHAAPGTTTSTSAGGADGGGGAGSAAVSGAGGAGGVGGVGGEVASTTSGVGGAAPLACAGPNSISTVQDSFDGPGLGALWEIIPGSRIAIAQTDDAVALDVSATPDLWGGVASVDRYDLRDCGVFIQLAQAFAVDSPGYVFFNVVNAQNEKIEIAAVGGTLQLKQNSTSVAFHVVKTVTYVPSEQVYLRIREVDGITGWEVSKDAIDWQLLHEEPSGLDWSDVQISFGGGTTGEASSTPAGTARFDALNVAP